MLIKNLTFKTNNHIGDISNKEYIFLFFNDKKEIFVVNYEVNKQRSEITKYINNIDISKDEKVFLINPFEFDISGSELIIFILYSEMNKYIPVDVLILQEDNNKELSVLIKNISTIESYYISYPIFINHPDINLKLISEYNLSNIYHTLISNNLYVNINNFLLELKKYKNITINNIINNNNNYQTQLSRLIDFHLVSDENENQNMLCIEDKMEVKTLKKTRKQLTKTEPKLNYSERIFTIDPIIKKKYSGKNFKIVAEVLNNILKWDIVQIKNKDNDQIYDYCLFIPKSEYFINIDGIFNKKEYIKQNSDLYFDIDFNQTPFPSDIWSEIRIASLILKQLDLPWYFRMRNVSLLQTKPMNSFKFNFPDNIQVEFTQGDCGFLTLNLYYKLRWDIYAVYFIPKDVQILRNNKKFTKMIKDKYDPSHFVNLVPTEIKISNILDENNDRDNRSLFVDIIGVSTFKELINYWSTISDEKNRKMILIKVDDEFLANSSCIVSSFEEDFSDNLEKKLTSIDEITNICIQKMELSDHYQVKKIIEITEHPLYERIFELSNSKEITTDLEQIPGIPSGTDQDISNKVLNSNLFEKENFYNRLINNYTLAYQLGIGPKVEFKKCNGLLVIYMEYLPIQNNKITFKKHESQIKNIIEILHNSKNIHGDYHIGNIAFTDKGEPKLIDFDLMFSFDEAKLSIPFLIWLKTGFDVESLEEMLKIEGKNLLDDFGDDIFVDL